VKIEPPLLIYTKTAKLWKRVQPPERKGCKIKDGARKSFSRSQLGCFGIDITKIASLKARKIF